MFRRRLLAFVWLLAVAVGFHVLLTYKGQSGPSLSAPIQWPKAATLDFSPTKYRLLMFAHPRCPCTKASIGELETLMAESGSQLDAMVLFINSEDKENELRSSSLDLAKSIPGVRTAIDAGGQLAKSFGAETSGHTLLYAPDGKLLFSGGITGSRGHLGENAGHDAIRQLVSGSKDFLPSSEVNSKVFGCELFDRCSKLSSLTQK